MKIYFAHPCFTEEQREFKKIFLHIFSAALSQTPYFNNITIIDPFDYAPDIEGDAEAKLKLSENIKTECIKLLEASDIIIALVDYNDTGTAFEAGYAHAVNKPVVLVSKGDCSAANAMLTGSAKEMIDNILEESAVEKLISIITLLYEQTIPL